jgi:Rieske Fe-S protein
MDVNRRGFIELAAASVAAVALPGCASVLMTRVVPANGAVRLSLASHPRLAQPGGYLRVQPEGSASPVYVLALEEGQYAALSPICTHLGCTVNIEGPRLVCPCHGSTYDRTGQVLRGPAEHPLRRLPTEVTGDGELVIRLEGAA